MKIIKRNGAEENFDISKIIMAVTKANAAVKECDRMTPRQIQRIAESVELACQGLGRAPTVEEMRWIWTGVMRASSSVAAFALVTAAMILTMSNSPSAPFLLITFMAGSSPLL